MKNGWQTKPFESCIEPVEYTRKVQRKDFLDDGQYPIVSQEAEFTNGYWNDEADVFRVSTPVVIFGDHTQVLKYVDFDFVLGADGVKILQPRAFLRPKFFFYQLQAANLVSLGYARHYRFLKELVIAVPPLAEQERIVGTQANARQLPDGQQGGSGVLRGGVVRGVGQAPSGAGVAGGAEVKEGTDKD